MKAKTVRASLRLSEKDFELLTGTQTMDQMMQHRLRFDAEDLNEFGEYVDDICNNIFYISYANRLLYLSSEDDLTKIMLACG